MPNHYDEYVIAMLFIATIGITTNIQSLVIISHVLTVE